MCHVPLSSRMRVGRASELCVLVRRSDAHCRHGGEGLGAEVWQKTSQRPIPLILKYHLHSDGPQFNNFPWMKPHPQKVTPQNYKKHPISNQENVKISIF